MTAMAMVYDYQLSLIDGVHWRPEKEIERFMTVSELVRELARERGWNLAELAKACDIPVDSVRSLAYGKSTNPTLDTLRRLATGTGRSPDQIMRMLGDSEPRPAMSA